MISYLDLEPCPLLNVVRCTCLMRWDALLSKRSIGSCFQNIHFDWSYQFGFIITTPLQENYRKLFSKPLPWLILSTWFHHHNTTSGELSKVVFKTFAFIDIFNFAFLSHPHFIIMIKSRQPHELWHHRTTAALPWWILSSWYYLHFMSS